ncbi:hypothetical protein BGZ91_001913 [Linnemannia elongata]|nr:hypothetical protein BGZ91_001913 [Linnemannia elongata]
MEPGRIQQHLVRHEQSLCMSAVGSDQQDPSEDQQDKVKATVITPFWTSAIWYPTITAMSVDKPLRIPRNQVLPAPGNSPHILEKNPMWSLSAWNVDGNKQAAQKRRKGRMPGQQAFIQWMQEQGRDPLSPSAMDLMNFLDYGLDEKKWKLTTIRTYKSAILQLLPAAQQVEIKEDELFREYLKVMGAGTFKRLHNATVDLTPVLSCLQALGNNHSMDIKNLTAKTCFLLATCGLLRPDDLACTDVAQCKLKDDELELIVVFPKEKRDGALIIKPVVIKSHPVEFFCPVKSYVEYRRRTSDQD